MEGIKDKEELEKKDWDDVWSGERFSPEVPPDLEARPQGRTGAAMLVIVPNSLRNSIYEKVDSALERAPQFKDKREEIYDEEIRPHYIVRLCIDDRTQVVDMWREKGLVCL